MTTKPVRRTFVPISRGSPGQQEARKTLTQLFGSCPLSTAELLTNAGLFVRSSVLATVLYLNELYQQIVEVPGVIMEFGCWFGKNLTLCESLRAVYEPYNYTRRIIGFDTFSGYPAASKRDPRSRYLARGGYTVPRGYVAYLRRLLEYHEQENPMAHIKKHEVVIGDVRRTLPGYLERNPRRSSRSPISIWHSMSQPNDAWS